MPCRHIQNLSPSQNPDCKTWALPIQGSWASAIEKGPLLHVMPEATMNTFQKGPGHAQLLNSIKTLSESGFSIRFPSLFFFWKPDHQFWCPTLGSYLHFKCVLFLSFSICCFHYNKHEMWDQTLPNSLSDNNKQKEGKTVNLILL